MDDVTFRDCLECANIQFTDDQFLALFSFFDPGCIGQVKWRAPVHFKLGTVWSIREYPLAAATSVLSFQSYPA